MNITLKKQLGIMVGIAMGAVLLLTLISYVMVKDTSIGSDNYQKIVNANELTADILPPPMYLVEVMMKVESLADVPIEKRGKVINEIKNHLQDFDTRKDRWLNSNDVSDGLKGVISKDLVASSSRLIDILQDEVLPAAAANNTEAYVVAKMKARELFIDHKDAIEKLVSKATSYATEQAAAGESSVGSYQTVFYIVVLLAVGLVFIVSFFFSRQILSKLGADPAFLQTVAVSINKNDFSVEIPPVDNPDSVMGAMSSMLNSIQLSVRDAVKNTLIKQALDATSCNVMLADTSRNIVYMNRAVEKMLREAEADLRKVLPHFSVDKIIGSNMDIFHKNPSHQAQLLGNLTSTYVGNIVVAGRSFRLIANPIFNNVGERMGSVVEWIDRTKEVAAEHELSRILGALETTTTNVMIADTDRKIIYMNKSVETMLRAAEADIRLVLSHFSVDKILGSNMDIFHKNPAHQIKLLESLTSTYTTNIVVGKRHFRLVANPILSKDGTRLGSVVEWLDRTQEVFVEGEVNHLVDAAAAGNFTARISTDGKNGFFLKLAEGLNTLVQTADKGLNDVVRVLGAIAKGDLTEKIDAEYAGTFGELKSYCNQTTENLTDMLTEIRTAAETIYTASSEIATGNADLSSRTEQQAANLEETASSMEELTSTVKLNADNAKQANALAEQASTVASDGGSLIQQVVTTMNEINQSSQKIADIIGVIDGIAFQTNILALNAAVEAARAGDQGRGFAVVASEVRTLAQRSANAAKDIKGLISDSVHKIESGNALVGKSGDTMKEIVTAIKRVNDIMAEIAAASAEQSTGIEEVSTAVSQMDEMTQQNAALVEEAAAAAESLQSQADQLNRAVSQFKLSNDAKNSFAQAPRLGVSKSAAPSVKKAPAKKLAPPSTKVDDEWESF